MSSDGDCFQRLRHDAEKGDAESQLALARVLLRNGARDDAMVYYEMASNQGNVESLVEYGDMVRGSDDKEAVRRYKEAAKKECPTAFLRLGYAYRDGSGMAKDIGESRRFFEQAAAKGDKEAAAVISAWKFGQRDMSTMGENRNATWCSMLCRRSFAPEAENPLYRELECLIGGMNETNIDLAKAQILLKKHENSDDAILLAMRATLFQPGIFRGKGLTKSASESSSCWKRSRELGLIERAENGEPWALLLAAWMFEDGSGVDKDSAAVVAFAMTAADKGLAAAENYVGYLYGCGYGVDEDNDTAFPYHEKAASKGYAAAQSNVGSCYENSWGVDKDESKALEYYRLAAAQGYGRAELQIGDMYQYGKASLPKSSKDAMTHYMIATEHDQAWAMNMIAAYLLDGDGVERNIEEGRRYFRMAAETGCVNSWLHLGSTYNFDDSGVHDTISSLECYKKGAKVGDKKCARQAGAILDCGWYLSHDMALAERYYAMASSLSDELSLVARGFLYFHGKGVSSRNFSKSNRYYTLAASRQVAEAKLRCGLARLDDNRDIPGALQYLSSAADLEDTIAMSYLSRMYMNINGRDIAKSKSFCQKVSAKAFSAEVRIFRKFY